MPDATEDKPPLLFLCQVLPYPPDGGVYIRSYHVLALLSQRFRITAICFYRRGQQRSPAAVAESIDRLRRFADVEAFPLPQEWSRWRMVWDHLRSVATGRVYTHYAYDVPQARKRLRELLSTRDFALVHADSLDLLCYFRLLRDLPIACTHHNVESALLRRRAIRETSRSRAAYVRAQAALMERAERTVTPTIALNVMVSDEDATHLRRIAPTACVTVVTNGVDCDAFQPEPYDGSGDIVCVGGLNWFPNLDGLEFLATEIIPCLAARGVRVQARWIGHATEQQRARFEPMGVHLTGYVDDIRPHLRRAACFINPLRVGGGTRLKILDAWALGKAIVSTRIGAEGLHTHDNENILLRDTADDFAAGVEAIIRDSALRTRLERGGRATVEQSYAWPRIGRALTQAYEPLIRHVAPS